MRQQYTDPTEIGERIQDLTSEIRDLAAAARIAQRRGEGQTVKTVITNPGLMIELMSACWSLGSALIPLWKSKAPSPPVEVEDAGQWKTGAKG